jgi:hypothetical protein
MHINCADLQNGNACTIPRIFANTLNHGGQIGRLCLWTPSIRKMHGMARINRRAISRKKAAYEAKWADK